MMSKLAASLSTPFFSWQGKSCPTMKRNVHYEGKRPYSRAQWAANLLICFSSTWQRIPSYGISSQASPDESHLHLHRVHWSLLVCLILGNFFLSFLGIASLPSSTPLNPLLLPALLTELTYLSPLVSTLLFFFLFFTRRQYVGNGWLLKYCNIVNTSEYGRIKVMKYVAMQRGEVPHGNTYQAVTALSTFSTRRTEIISV